MHSKADLDECRGLLLLRHRCLFFLHDDKVSHRWLCDIASHEDEALLCADSDPGICLLRIFCIRQVRVDELSSRVHHHCVRCRVQVDHGLPLPGSDDNVAR